MLNKNTKGKSRPIISIIRGMNCPKHLSYKENKLFVVASCLIINFSIHYCCHLIDGLLIGAELIVIPLVDNAGEATRDINWQLLEWWDLNKCCERYAKRWMLIILISEARMGIYGRYLFHLYLWRSDLKVFTFIGKRSPNCGWKI